MGESALTREALAELKTFQTKDRRFQGVYVVHYDGRPAYVGKAKNIEKRLSDHLFKLSGRNKIDFSRVRFQALYLDESMSTAANESLLIAQFKARHPDMWNGAGFGTKDPGKERDTTKTSPFDLAYPINAEYLVECPAGADTGIKLATLLSSVKKKLPYRLRYGKIGKDADRSIRMSSQKLPAQELLQEVVQFLGGTWHAAVMKHGMVLYNVAKDYPATTVILRPRSDND